MGTALGPLLGGVAIQFLKGPLASTKGFAAMWLVCALAILASIPFLRRLRHAAGDDARRRSDTAAERRARAGHSSA